ncbi:MAG TPA: hypothetical protein VFX58_09625, partial [Chitinophagaceae bacterium]|nr:hypothetical protein [Chitinophagaceae bacterium]
DQPTVQTLFRQMLQSSDKKLKYSTLLLLVRDNKSYPDSLLKYFASLDEYRYQLYKDLHRAGKAGKFPAAFNNHLDLGKSSLLQRKSYGKPDTLVYIERRAATVQGKKGFIYFFKYKNKKDDMTWKLATVGLLPAQPGQFEFEEEEIERAASEYYAYRGLYLNRDYDFTNLGSTRIREEEPLASQINKELKKLLYSKRKSAREFYGDNEEEDRFDMISTNIEIRD